ncbi:hypothetical protein [Candidatus Odyssella acanthamoebae]|uniref:Endonuclease/exonuclease/phosphatase domain-containing protein n=1 Tax=Candidatus Odyssella acanthamoebae TaxID=91604 RepID=A0A077AR85_9PROT|nr:hypothetical protein [Candidatus Paracaedibacter acanthamoebae]AIK95697.1 hypothetical protein ID47_01490 [Candidatus Paracaedibacter acanthamoebae]
MTRILYWNIQNFSCNAKNAESTTKLGKRLNFILNYIFGNLGNTPPDIICFVEGKGAAGDLGAFKVNGSLLGNANTIEALTAVLTLLQMTRRNESWCLVPPLCSGKGGKSETTAVYYNSNKLIFTGPCAWGLNVNQQAIPLYINDANFPAPPAANPLTPYVAWALRGLPNKVSNITVPNSNPAVFFNENQLAAECVNGDYPGLSDRKPYRTTFTEINNLNGNRDLNIYTIHTSPASASGAMWNMLRARGVSSTIPTNTVNIILGDFNVDTVDDQSSTKKSVLESKVYKAFRDNKYTVQLWPGTDASNWETIKPYCMTHLLHGDSATPYNIAGQKNPSPRANYYPRYGYMGSGSEKRLSDSGAIDNIMTKYAADLQPPNNAATNMTIINPIVGSPYNCINNPPNVPVNLTQGLAFPQYPAFSAIPPGQQQSLLPLPTPGYMGGIIDPQNGPNQIDPALTAFQTAFKEIHDLSDHLPLIIDI